MKLQKELSQERNLYLDLANAIPSGIYRLRVFKDAGKDTDKWSNPHNQPYIFEFVNDRFDEIFKFEKGGFEKNPPVISEFLSPDDKAEFIERNVQANLLVIPFVWEGIFTIQGEPVWVHFESIPRVMDNGDIVWTGTLNDISERKRQEHEIELKNQELHKLNAEKDKFLSIMAHDLKSPFDTILGFSKFISDQVHSQDFDSMEEYVEIIKESSQKAVDLLRNLMEWTRTQTGRSSFNPENYNLWELINENISLLKVTAKQKEIAISKVCDSEIMVHGDKAMIGTVIRNLISNAIKFTSPGGSVKILVETHNQNIKISIIDTGIGISDLAQQKLFRIDSSYSTLGTLEETGTGLGLILCKEFVEKHNGQIWVESVVNEGSQFNFTIPRLVTQTIE